MIELNPIRFSSSLDMSLSKGKELCPEQGCLGPDKGPSGGEEIEIITLYEKG